MCSATVHSFHELLLSNVAKINRRKNKSVFLQLPSSALNAIKLLTFSKTIINPSCSQQHSF